MSSRAAGTDIRGNARRPLAASLVKPWARRAARSTLAGRNRSRADPTAGRFTGADVDRLLDATWAHFDGLVSDLPDEPTTGSRQNVMLACLTLSMLQALRAEGVERGYAIELIGEWTYLELMVEETQPISKELSRIEETAMLSARSQFEQAKYWRAVNLVLGVPAAVLARVPETPDADRRSARCGCRAPGERQEAR